MMEHRTIHGNTFGDHICIHQGDVIYQYARDASLDRSLERLDSLDNLPEASFDAENKQHVATCLPNTRRDVLQEIVTAAAGNQGNGRAIMAILLEQRGHEFKITQEIVTAAAGNQGNGREIMAILLEQRGHELKITQSRSNSSAHKASPLAPMMPNNPKAAQRHPLGVGLAPKGPKSGPTTSLSPQPERTISPTPTNRSTNQSVDESDKDDSSQRTGMESGFGYTQLFSLTDASVQVSSKTFQYLNETVEEHWQHWGKDASIKVAILDSGFDLEHADFKLARTKIFTGPQRDTPTPAENETIQKDRVKDWRNFCPDQNETDVTDIDGHGTQVAGIILRLAPHAQLYIARICAGDAHRGLLPQEQVNVERKDYHTPQPEAVEKAIEWALRNGVDIINLSMGFRNCPKSALERLRKALEKATEQKVVVFAATSNEGLHEEVAWPARDRQYALGVHSCDDSGRKPSAFSAEPSSHGENFMVVGENILSQWPTAKGGGFRVATGTSFSAPVASAIGALVLQFVKQWRCKQHYQRVGGIVQLEDLCTNVGMSKVLERISTHVEGKFWSIHPKLFWKDSLPSGRDKTQHAWDIIEVALKPS